MIEGFSGDKSISEGNFGTRVDEMLPQELVDELIEKLTPQHRVPLARRRLRGVNPFSVDLIAEGGEDE